MCPARSQPVKPMLATPGVPPAGDGWACEMKWDGQRIMAVTSRTGTKLWSRNGNPSGNYFPELVDALDAELADRDVIVDGEVVALDKGRPSFGRLQRRMHVVRPTAELRRSTPVVYYVFDVLEVDGEPTMSLPYLERRAVLAGLGLNSPRIQVPPHWVDVDPQSILAVAEEHGLEGIVTKRLTSTYRPGCRSPTWIKTPLRKNTEAIIVGLPATAPGCTTTPSEHSFSAPTMSPALSDTSAPPAPASPQQHGDNSATISKASHAQPARSAYLPLAQSSAPHTGSNQSSLVTSSTGSHR